MSKSNLNNFSRHELAVALSRRLMVPVIRAEQIVDVTLETIAQALYSGNRVEFRNFGILEPVTRKARPGRNPKRPEDGEYLVPERRVVRFRLGKKLDIMLNGE